jgi:cell division topological specificity factor
MKLINYFRRTFKPTAVIAKERLQIIVSHERGASRKGPDYLQLLQQELIQVVAKYVDIDQDKVKVELERTGNCSVLELNVTLPNLE